MTLPIDAPGRSPPRCRACHRPVRKTALIDGLGPECAEDAGLVPHSPRARRSDQTGPDLFDEQGDQLMTVELLRKKPITVATMLWDGTPERAEDIQVWVSDIAAPGEPSAFMPPNPLDVSNAMVWNSEERCWISVPVGHRVVKGALNELYPLSPDAEAATFERVSTEPGA